MKAIDRQWVVSNSSAFNALIQQGYLMVHKSAKNVRGVRWVLMQKLIEVED